MANYVRLFIHSWSAALPEAPSRMKPQIPRYLPISCQLIALCIVQPRDSLIGSLMIWYGRKCQIMSG
eukprot:scaffold150331_cov18-Prasinocladus_malaysianus.AAC.1